jgi:hypothetical protein
MKIVTASTEEKKERAKLALEATIEALYPKNEEMRLINLGISDPTHPDYLAYRQQIAELIEQYRSEWQ